MSTVGWTAEDRERYTRHAAPQSIAALRVKARRALRVAQAELDWLDRLQSERDRQVAAGEWPPKPEEAPDVAAR